MGLLRRAMEKVTASRNQEEKETEMLRWEEDHGKNKVQEIFLRLTGKMKE